MPPVINIDRFYFEIKRRALDERQTHSQIRQYLVDEGITISERAMRRQLKEWGITRRNAARDVSALPIISHHHIMENDDETSAASLNSQGIPASSRQAQRARLENDLRARDRTAEQRDEQRQQTAVAIGESLAEGTTRNFGRQYMKTALQINHSQRARKQLLVSW